MEATARVQVQFGYNPGIPEGVTAAWGARWIAKQDGDIDQLWDRQGAAGDEAEVERIIERLNGGVNAAAQFKAAELLRDRTMRTRESGEFVLYHNGGFIVKGNTNASAGYLYVCAYFEPKALGDHIFPAQGDPKHKGRSLPWLDFIHRVNGLASERGEETVFGTPKGEETPTTYTEVYPEAKVTHYIDTKGKDGDTVRITTDSERVKVLFDLAAEG